MLLILALRNLLRAPFRNILTGGALMLAVILAILGHGLIRGIDANIIGAHREVLSGDTIYLPVSNDIYTQDPQKSLPLPSSIPENCTTRIMAQVMILHEGYDVPALLIGYDPLAAPPLFSYTSWRSQGSWPKNTNEVIMGNNLAHLLELSISQTLLIKTRTIKGSHTAQKWNIAGFLSTQNAYIDTYSIWIPQKDFEDFLGSTNRVHQILCRGETSANFHGWDSFQAEDIAHPLLQTNQTRKKALYFIFFMILGINNYIPFIFFYYFIMSIII